MTSARQQLKELQERNHNIKVLIAEPQRTGNPTDAGHTQEWFACCELQIQTHQTHQIQQWKFQGKIKKSKSDAKEDVAIAVLSWLRLHNFI
jgi:hypothetical protein